MNGRPTKRAIWIRLSVIALATAAIAAPIASASDDLVLRRDGGPVDRAVADPGTGRGGDGVVLRRDGSAAEPFVSGHGTPVLVGRDPSGLGAAELVTGIGALVIVLGIGATAALTGRRPRTVRP